jgi:DNA-binding GntR family transcriptional regulator
LQVRSKRDVGFITDYTAAGRSPSIHTLTLEVIPVAQVRPEAQKYLPYGDQELMIRHLNVQSVDGIPHAISDSYIPHHYFSSLLPHLRDTSIDLYKHMKELGYPVTHKKECLHVDMPTLYERRLLQLIDLLRVQIVRLDCRVWSGDKLVEVCLLCDRADLYEFHYDIPMTE